MNRVNAELRSQLRWRVPLYRSYFQYFLHCTNYQELIQYRRTGRRFDAIEVRGGPVIVCPDPEDAWFIFQEIWLDREYTRYYRGSPEVVIDIGANIGVFTLLARHLWPRCRVHAYEPDPQNVVTLQSNLEHNQVEGVTVHNAAVSDAEGRRTLFQKGHSGWHSLYPEALGGPRSSVQVETVDLPAVIETAGGRIDLLKMDCEGAEWAILRDNEELLRAHIGYVAMEYHELNDARRADLVALFERAGFTCRSTPPTKLNTGMLYAARRSEGSRLP
jgi:FkbM family methyltransferase